MSFRDLLRRLNPSLLTRVLLALAIVGLAPMSFAVYRLIGINQAAMTDQVERTLDAGTGSIANRLESSVELWLWVARFIAGQEVMADPTSPGARRLLANNLEVMGPLGVQAIAFVNPEGERYLHGQLADDEELKASIQSALAPSALDQVVTFKTASGPLVRVSVELPGGLGFVWLICDSSRVERGLDAYVLGTDVELALIDGEGNPVVGSVEGFPASMIEWAKQADSHGVRSSFEEDDGEGVVEFVGTYHPVDFADWRVLGRQPASEAHRVSQRMRREAWLVMALTTLLVAGLTTVAYSSVVRPVRNLVSAQRELAGLGAAPTGGNEIEQLTSSFDSLRKGIRDRQALDEVFLGRYQVRDVIGSGAMGTVFLARDPKLERDVALKTIRLDRKLEPEKRQDLISRLIKEAVTGARFSHPNIVAVYDVEDRPEAAFLAMEYVDGVSLESFLWEAGQLSFELTVPLGLGIARGLAAAHAHDLVHRDVKPANVLLGLDSSIKLTDFGIADLVSALSKAPDVVFGTPGYLPPETIRGKGYDKSGDLFSLGAILYYCVTGSRPFEGRNAKEVIRKTLFGKLERPRRLNASVPEPLEELIMSLLTVERADRPADAEAVAETLEDFASEQRLRWRAPLELMRRRSRLESGEQGRFVPTVRVGGSEETGVSTGL
jgi:serine/threonine-protein kinase